MHLPHSRPLELVLVCDIVSDIIVKGPADRENEWQIIAVDLA